MADAGLRVVGRADLEPAWCALAASFDDDPMFRYLLPGARTRRRWLRAFMAEALHQCSAARAAFVPAEGPAFGALGMIGPGDYPPAESPWSFIFGLGHRPAPGLPTWRLLRTGTRVIGDMLAAHPKEPHVYIMVVGVDPAHKGRGLGRRFMEHAIATAEAAAVPTYLETSNPTNLGFYRRFGFEVVEEKAYPRGAPPLWTMQRPA